MFEEDDEEIGSLGMLTAGLAAAAAFGAAYQANADGVPLLRPETKTKVKTGVKILFLIGALIVGLIVLAGIVGLGALYLLLS